MNRSRPLAFLPLPLLALALAAAPIAGQEEPELVTDRPDQTESAVTVPPGRTQIEVGWIEAEEEEGGVDTTVTEAPGTLVRIGLSPRWELRLGWAGEIEVDSRGAGAGGRLDATGDASVGAKVRLRDQNVAIPEMALLVTVNLPVGGDAVTSDRYDPSILLSMGNTFNDRISLGYNLGVARESARNAAGAVESETLFRHSAALGFTLSRRLGAFVELFGTLPGSSGAPDTFSADAGVTWLARPNLQLDLGAGVGLNSAADDRFLFAGISWRLPR